MASEGDLAKISTLAQDAAFRSRVQAALVFKALGVLLGGRGAVGEYEWHYALGISRNVADYSGKAAWAIAAQPEVVATANNVTDVALTTALDNLWPHITSLEL